MIITFEKKTHTLWHSNCEGGNIHSPPMKEISARSAKPGQPNILETLVECTLCGQRAAYPHGESGPIECPLVADDE